MEATIAYMHTRQFIPFKRMSEYFSDVCNLPISQGAICDILERFAQKALPAWLLISNEVENSKAIGSDETGAKVNGKKAWFWTWQSRLATFIAFSGNRGTDTINANFENGFKDAVLVHDCWKSHFETKVMTHQLCTAHLLRELNFLKNATNLIGQAFSKIVVRCPATEKGFIPTRLLLPNTSKNPT